jgi:nucleoside-diphosphate-sugar epimerase
MPLVVPGAAGFIGRVLVELLAARGHAVTGIDRRPGIPHPATPVAADLTELVRRRAAAAGLTSPRLLEAL